MSCDAMRRADVLTFFGHLSFFLLLSLVMWCAQIGVRFNGSLPHFSGEQTFVVYTAPPGLALSPTTHVNDEDTVVVITTTNPATFSILTVFGIAPKVILTPTDPPAAALVVDGKLVAGGTIEFVIGDNALNPNGAVDVRLSLNAGSSYHVVGTIQVS